MGPPLRLRDAVTLDKDKDKMFKDDLVRVVDGEHRDKQGKVIHIFRYFVFLQSRAVPENGGIFVTKAENCKVTRHT